MTDAGNLGRQGASGGMADPATGTAEVRTGLHSGRGTGEEYSGLGFAEGGPAAGGGVRERVLDTARHMRESATHLAGTVRDRAGTLGHRAGEAATEARHRLSAASERTNQVLEERGLLGRLRENPLPALGVAFGIGFLLAGGRRDMGSTTPATRVRRELRDAVMAGLAAGAAQATRGFLQSAGGPDGLLGSLLGGKAPQGERTTTGRSPNLEGSRGRMSGGLGRSTGGSTGGSSAGMSGTSSGGSTGEHRPPSHRENL